ncbi:MAG: PilT/PilU family type 4a pilus ATPase [Candidatus Omnitrophica bacterium]|nr:PilT/PilU family type 4a pilus ATPase [Candidatus Omnitrophota bacterium]MCG2710851.1 PilT/PilU family type 4a pilus ATPase [Candidatus Omnitrophota bacterium]
MAQIDALFNRLINSKGSDLHLEQGQRPKMRVHGKLTECNDIPALTQEYLCEILKEISGEINWQRLERTGDLDFAYALDNGARFRSNYFKFFYGYGAIFRLIPSKICSFEELGVPDVMKQVAQLKSGLVLVTGPTGSGKSSTLAAIIDLINSGYVKKILTLEEPIEFLHQNKQAIIVHREIGSDAISFAQGLRSALKTDVNIIMVGEMRDRDTIELALTAAEMGILILGTLHTNSAAKTIDRIIDSFPSNKKNQTREILANTLQIVCAQQLLPSIDGARRWAAFEILLRSIALPSLIRQGDTKLVRSEINTHARLGMVSMDNYLLKLVQEGKVSIEEAYVKAMDKTLFQLT